MLLSAASRVTQLSSSRQRAQLALRHGARRRPVARRRDAPFRSRAPSRPSFIGAREELGPRGNDSQVSGAARCLAVVARAEPPPPDAAQLDAQRPRREVVLRDHAQKHAPRGQATVAGRSAAQTKDSIGAPRPSPLNNSAISGCRETFRLVQLSAPVAMTSVAPSATNQSGVMNGRPVAERVATSATIESRRKARTSGSSGEGTAQTSRMAP
jgi:hypothetical protein